MINFAKGHPNSSLLPIDPMKELLSLMQEQGNLNAYLNYPKQDTGNEEFVHQLKEFLAQETSQDDAGETSETTPDNEIFISHGVSHAVELLCATLTQPGDVVGMEVPTYFLVGRIFENHGLGLQPLPMTTTTYMLDVTRFEQLLDSGDMTPPRLIYTIPTNHNPTASTLPVKDRIKLARLAEKYNFYVVADEVYHLLDWRDESTTPRPARMACYNNNDSDNDGRCLSVSSFTKIFCPGVRCGWIEGPRHVIQQVVNYGYVQSQGGCVPFVGELLRLGLEHGICRNVLSQLKNAYKERAELLYTILQSSGTIQVAVKPTGGYFLWIQLPSCCDASAFAKYTLERGIKILPIAASDPFTTAAEGDDDDSSIAQSYARLCFATLPLQELEEGAHKLVQLLAEYQASGK